MHPCARQLCKSASLFLAPLKKTIWVVSEPLGYTHIYRTHRDMHLYSVMYTPSRPRPNPLIQVELSTDMCTCQAWAAECVFTLYSKDSVCLCCSILISTLGVMSE